MLTTGLIHGGLLKGASRLGGYYAPRPKYATNRALLHGHETRFLVLLNYVIQLLIGYNGDFEPGVLARTFCRILLPKNLYTPLAKLTQNWTSFLNLFFL